MCAYSCNHTVYTSEILEYTLLELSLYQPEHYIC